MRNLKHGLETAGQLIILSLIGWFGGWLIYSQNLLELQTLMAFDVFQTLLTILIAVGWVIAIALIKRGHSTSSSQSLSDEKHKPLPNPSSELHKELATIKETLELIDEKVTDLHAFLKIVQKRISPTEEA